ncbi:phosphorylase family protein [Vibrio campbellii]|uniref:phosphorylase family protein n=1 Tax=Vibrio campbellii TaxID=680 RepID=UPI002109EC99|nr:hypothetical protein [Vibrio campbellii]
MFKKSLALMPAAYSLPSVAGSTIGIAGASDPKLDPLDVVVSTRLVQHDVDLTAFNIPKGLLPDYEERYFYVDKTLQKYAFDAAVDTLGKESVYRGIIASGDQFIASKVKVTGIFPRIQRDGGRNGRRSTRSSCRHFQCTLRGDSHHIC